MVHRTIHMDTRDDCIRLQARSPCNSIARSWQLDIKQDLFGWTIVSWQWGRLGGSTTTKSAAFPDSAGAQRFARKLLARRDSAPRRIGIPYIRVPR